MLSKRQRLDHEDSRKNSINMDMNILPKEVLCIIFSCLDEKSIRSASKACKLWFELIRSDLKLSSHICLVNDGLKEFQTKLEKSEWIWERWPVLKSLELRSFPHFDEQEQESMRLVKSINFKRCEGLEQVQFNVNFNLIEFWQNYHTFVTITKFIFNPQVEMNSFGLEHASSMDLRLYDLNKDKVCQGLQLIGEKAKCLQNLSIFIGEKYSGENMRGEIDFLIKNGFSSMFKGLNCTLEYIYFRNSTEDNYDLDYDLLNLLSEQCKNLTEIIVDSDINFYRFPSSIGRFQYLKKLTVPKLCYIESFAQNYNTITYLCVDKIDMVKLKKYDLRSMCQNLKELKKCCFQVRVNAVNNPGHYAICYGWTKIIDETFQAWHEVKFIFKIKTESYFEAEFKETVIVTKNPYQKSVTDQDPLDLSVNSRTSLT